MVWKDLEMISEERQAFWSMGLSDAIAIDRDANWITREDISNGLQFGALMIEAYSCDALAFWG